MKRLNKLAAVFCVAAMALTAMTGCEGSDMFSVNSPDWLSEKIDSIEKANQSTEEVLVGMNEDVYTVGNTDFSSAFFTSFSKYYVVQDNQKWNAVFNLNINPSATNTYKNFALFITNDVDRGGTGYAEYGAIRFDNQPSGNSEWGDHIDRSCVHKELVYFQEHQFEIHKRAQVLGMLTQTEKGMCVAGTHGKTTTSTMAAFLMDHSHVGCNAFLGGISKNYQTNLLLSDKSDYVVIEADEFDRSFHWLTPYATVITATDSDHLDIYGTHEAYLESFRKYTSLIRPDGYLIIKEGLELKPDVQPGVTVYTYSTEKGDFHAENIRIDDGEIYFDYISPLGNITNVQLGVPVFVNIENGIAAMALAQIGGATTEEIKAAMPQFRGVDRRIFLPSSNISRMQSTAM